MLGGFKYSDNYELALELVNLYGELITIKEEYLKPALKRLDILKDGIEIIKKENTFNESNTKT